MPYRFVNLTTGKTTGNVSNPAEIGPLILEFGTLSKLTHKPVFFDTAKKALHHAPSTSIAQSRRSWSAKTSTSKPAMDEHEEATLEAGSIPTTNTC